MKALGIALIATALLAACGGGTDDGRREPSATATEASLEAIEAVAFAFIDSSLGSTLAVSVAPNDAGLEWIDIVLDEGDAIASVTAQTAEGPIRITIEGDVFVLSVPEHDITARGEIGGSEVTVISGGEATVHQVDRDAAGGLRRRDSAGIEAIGYARGERTGEALVGQEAENPLDYMVDRPANVTAGAAIEVATEVNGAPLDLAEATGFGLYVTQCTSATSTNEDSSITCTAGVDEITVHAQVPLPPPEDWKESNLGVFASRERCEAWVDHNSSHETAYKVLSKTVVPLLGVYDKRVGFAAAAVTGTMEFILGRTTSVKCGTITVADELIADALSVNEGFTVTVGASAVALEYEFSSDSTDVFPFSLGEKVASPLRLIGTRIDGAGSEDDGDEGSGSDGFADIDGSYRAATGLYPVDDGDGAMVAHDEVTLLIQDGRIVDFSGGYAVTDAPTETGPQDRVLCRSDVTLDLVLADILELVDGAGEGPLDWRATQSLGRPTSLNNSGECDPDLAGEQIIQLTARFTVADGTALVEIVLEGRSLTTLTLSR